MNASLDTSPTNTNAKKFDNLRLPAPGGPSSRLQGKIASNIQQRAFNLRFGAKAAKISQERLEFIESEVGKIRISYSPNSNTIKQEGKYDGTYHYLDQTTVILLSDLPQFIDKTLSDCDQLVKDSQFEHALSLYFGLKQLISFLKAYSPRDPNLNKHLITTYDHLSTFFSRIGLLSKAQEYSDLACNYLRVFIDEYKTRNGGQDTAKHSTGVTVSRGQQQVMLARLILKNCLFLSDLGRHAEVANMIAEVGTLMYSCILKMNIIILRTMLRVLRVRASRLTQLYLQQDDYMLTQEDYEHALKELDEKDTSKNHPRQFQRTLLDELTSTQTQSSTLYSTDGRPRTKPRKSSAGLDISGISEEPKMDRFGNHYTQKELQELKSEKNSSSARPSSTFHRLRSHHFSKLNSKMKALLHSGEKAVFQSLKRNLSTVVCLAQKMGNWFPRRKASQLKHIEVLMKELPPKEILPVSVAELLTDKSFDGSEQSSVLETVEAYRISWKDWASDLSPDNCALEFVSWPHLVQIVQIFCLGSIMSSVEKSAVFQISQNQLSLSSLKILMVDTPSFRSIGGERSQPLSGKSGASSGSGGESFDGNRLGRNKERAKKLTITDPEAVSDLHKGFEVAYQFLPRSLEVTRRIFQLFKTTTKITDIKIKEEDEDKERSSVPKWKLSQSRLKGLGGEDTTHPRLSVSLFGNKTSPSKHSLENSSATDATNTNSRGLRSAKSKDHGSRLMMKNISDVAREEVRYVQPLRGGSKEPGIIPIVREVKTVLHNQNYEQKLLSNYMPVTDLLPSDKAMKNFFKKSILLKAHQDGVSAVFETTARLSTKIGGTRLKPFRALRQVESCRTTGSQEKRTVPNSFMLRASYRTTTIDPRREKATSK